MAADIRSLSATIAAEINARPEQAAAAIELARRRRDGAFHRALSQGGHRRAGRHAVAHAGRAAGLSARTGSAPRHDPRFDHRPGQADRRAEGKIAAAATKAELEDLYLPYKPKRRTTAEIARERGLGPLAEAILGRPRRRSGGACRRLTSRPRSPTSRRRSRARATSSPKAFAENADLVGKLRAYMKQNAHAARRVVDGKQEAGAKFSDYFDHIERWATAPGHRALAMLRGRNEEVLTLDDRGRRRRYLAGKAGRADDRGKPMRSARNSPATAG